MKSAKNTEFGILFGCRVTAFFYCVVMSLIHYVLGNIALTQQALSITHATQTVIVFGILACLHLSGIISFCTKPRSSLAKKVKHNMYYEMFFSSTGEFGRRGSDYELRLMLREMVEIPSQTLQAYLMSRHVSATAFSTVYTILVILNCFIVPFCLRQSRMDKMKRRNNVLLLDIMFDIVLGAVIPLLILVPHFMEYITNPLVVTDMRFSTSVISSIKHLVVQSDLDLFISAIPMLSSHLMMEALRNNWHEDDTTSNATTSPLSKKPLNSIVPYSSPNLKSTAALQRYKKSRRLADKIYFITSSIWGICLTLVLLITHFKEDACVSNPFTNQSCVVKTKPLSVYSDDDDNVCHCLFMYLHGERSPSLYENENLSQLEIIESELSTAVSRDTLLTLSFRQCSITEIPSIVESFTQLNMLTVGRLDHLQSFETRIDKLQRLIVLKIAHGSISEIPSVLENPPATLFFLILSDNGFKSLPNWVGSAWKSVSTLLLDNNTLSNVPPSLYNLTNLNDLNLKDNSLTTLDANLVSNFKKLKMLDLGGNLLTALPEKLKELPLQNFNVDSNKLETLDSVPWTPLEISEWKSDNGKLTLANNPVCLLEEISQTTACAGDCNPLCDIREYNRFYCSLNCNTTACNFHNGKCLEDYRYSQHNPLA